MSLAKLLMSSVVLFTLLPTSPLNAQVTAGTKKPAADGETVKKQRNGTVLNTVRISGQFELKDEVERMVLMSVTNRKMVTDSFLITGNRFTLRKEVTEPSQAGIIFRFKQRPGEEKARYERLNVFLEPGQMNIKVKDSVKFAKVTGSKAHTDYEMLTKDKRPYENRMMALRSSYMQASREKNTAEQSRIDQELEKVDSEMKEAVYLPFLNQHINSPIAVFILNEYAGYSINAKKVAPLYQRLPPALRQSASGVALGEQIAIAKITGVGVEALDFTQTDTIGIPVSLKSFRGKYVLLDFWASWCGPCRAESPYLVKAFQRFKDKNFTILSVSLDQQEQKDAWMKAIHKDELTWTHVSDLNYFDNAAARLYGIRAIPQNLLINPKGVIVAKNLRGDDIESALTRLLR